MGRLYGHALAGVRVQKVQKVQKVQRVLVGGCAAIMNKTFATALTGEGKPYNRAYGAGKCTPFGAAHHFPRRGKFALCPAFELISSSKHSAANTSPSGWQANVICRGSEATRKSRETLSRGGGAEGRRGAFPRAKRGCLVFAAARQHTYSSPRSGNTFPSEPSEPFEPSRPQGVSLRPTAGPS